tara:strand:- start:1020 stop:1334 length:315 start_codon:yes stop_codon:yes gene_type:complete
MILNCKDPALRSLKRPSRLIGRAPLTCVVLTCTAQADNFAITESDGTKNGNVAVNAINGFDKVGLEMALTTINVSGGIETTSEASHSLYNYGNNNVEIENNINV